MNTHFASPERTDPQALAHEIRTVSANPVVAGILHSAAGLLAVLDENRQIVAMNDDLIRTLGIDDPAEVLGLRPGEALQCVHAHDEPAGCGTSRFCATCGAAIAILASLKQNTPAERLCALSANQQGKVTDLALTVKCRPLQIEGQRFLLFLAQDVTVEQQRAELERVFFHDINNLLTGLLYSTRQLTSEAPSEFTDFIADTVLRLHREFAIQRRLSANEQGAYQPMWCTCTVGEVLGEIERSFAGHPVAAEKHLVFNSTASDTVFSTDVSALLRVANNMIVNALEATQDGGVVRVQVSRRSESVVFRVWNSGFIPPDTAMRVFHRNFSTKAEFGRGVGTYSMKLFGEEVLGGRVTFTSTEEDGTVFEFHHPIRETGNGANPAGVPEASDK